MTYLPSLIKKIDNFYHLINLGAVTPDYSYDPNKPQEQEIDERGDKLYQDIMSNLDNFENSSIADEVWTLAELYKASLLTGSGFDECLKRAKAAKGSVKDLANGAVDARDLADATRYILEIELNLTKAARSAPPVPKDDQVIAAQFKAIINDVKEKQANEEMAEQDSVYEEKKGEDAGEDFGYLIGNQIGVDKRKEQYEQEIAHLKEAQNNPNYQFSESERKNVPLLINVNRRLLAQMQSFVRVEATLSAAPEDPEYKAAFEKEKEQLNVLRKERYKIRVELAKHFQTKKYDQFIEQANKATDPREKAWFDLNARFQQLRLSDKYNKKPLTAAIMQLIEETGKIVKPLMGQESFIPINITTQREQELIAQVKDADAKTLTPEKYDEIRAARKAKEHGLLGDIIRRQKGRRGGGSRRSRINQYDVGSATFHGLVDKLSEKINTALHVSKLNITQYKNAAKQKVHNELKPQVDAVAEALRNIVKFNREEDRQAKYKAIRELKEKIKERMDKETAIKSLEKNVRLMEFFKAYEAKLYFIDRMTKEGTDWTLTNQQKQYIAKTIEDFDRLSQIVDKYYGGKNQLEPNFRGTIDYIENILNRLEYESKMSTVRENDIPAEVGGEKVRLDTSPEATAPKTIRVRLVDENKQVYNLDLDMGAIKMLSDAKRPMHYVEDTNGESILQIYIHSEDLAQNAPEAEETEAEQAKQRRASRMEILKKLAEGQIYA
jgi:hypothetical protein